MAEQPEDRIGQVLTDAELTAIVRAFAHSRTKRRPAAPYFTEEEAAQVASKINYYRVMAHVVDLCIAGDVVIDLDESGEIMFSAVRRAA